MKHRSKRILGGILALAMLASTGCSTQGGTEATSVPETVAETRNDSGLETETEETVQNAGEGSEIMEITAQNPNLAVRVAPEEEHYICELSDEVTRTHVYYQNRFEIELAGDLYVAKNADLETQHPALVIGPPFGGVKEQGPGVYANELAQRGFVVLTFDPSYHGYSGGQPRMVGSTDIYAEDFSAGVDYLGSLDYVNREQIGAIGICGSGGFALSAAAMDSRIKAIATSVMYDISSMGNSSTGEERQATLDMTR